jgi:fumarate hydratase, class II
MSANEFRVKRDSMGEVRVPKQAYYGAQTQRAVENFKISGIGFPAKFVRALALVKFAARPGEREFRPLGWPKSWRHPQRRARGHGGTAQPRIRCRYFSDRLGTSTNPRSDRSPRRGIARQTARRQGHSSQRPRQHGRSSSDVIPTAIHIAALGAITRRSSPMKPSRPAKRSARLLWPTAPFPRIV